MGIDGNKGTFSLKSSSKNIENKKVIHNLKRDIKVSDLKIQLASEDIIKSNRTEKYKYAF